MRREIIYLLIAILFTMPSVSFAINTTDYNDGWNHFSNNNREDARIAFEKATLNPETKAEAFLSLSFLDWCESNQKKAFNHFKEFYENSDNPYPYLYGMFSVPFMGLENLTDIQLKFFEKIAGDHDMNGTLQAMISEKLAKYHRDRNNFKKSKELFDKTGALNKWQVLGSFDNISGSGYDKDWDAVSKSRENAVFKNTVDADIKWYTPSAIREDYWFSFDYYFPLTGIIAYAQTFVKSPVEQEVYLRAGTSGSLKIWINDALVAAIPEERNCDLDIYAWQIKLNEGNNRILVQIGQSEIDRANFMIRLTDENAHPISGLTHTPQYSEYNKSGNEESNELLPFFAEEYFKDKIKNDPDNLLYYIILGETYLRNDKSYEGTDILKKAEKIAPQSSFIKFRLSEAYSRAENQTDYSREIENIKQNDPNSFFALSALYTEAIETEKYSEAETFYAKIKELYGNNEVIDAMEFQLASVQGKVNEMLALGKKLYNKYPYSYEYMYLNYIIENDVFKNTQAAKKVLENYNKQYFNSQALGLLANKYINLGEAEKGLKTFQKRITAMPYAMGFIYNYAQVLQKMQRYSEALNVLEEVKKLSPYTSDIYNTEGYIYKGMKNEAKAKESFKKSIYYGPTSYDSRKQLRILDNKTEVFDLFPKIDLNELISKAPTAAEYPEDNAICVLLDEQLIFYPEGAQEQRNEIAIKILNQSGIESWKEYYIGFNRNNQKLILDKYEIIKANGQKIKAETDNRGLVVFTNMEVGDVLHLDYRLQNNYTGILSKHFYDVSLMQYTIPAMYLRSAILVPENRNFEYKVLNSNPAIEPKVSEIENMKLYEWTNSNMPAIKYELYMSPLVDVAPVLIYSSIPEWKIICNWYKDLTTNKINVHSDFILKETHKEILKDNEDKSPLEKAEMFYNYILNNITYSAVSFMQSNFIPQKPSRTITTRLGDCKDVSTLFVALCRETGINANLVLLNSRENGKNTLALPSNNFNHCIAQLEIDNKTYYLELTDNKLPFGAALDDDLQSYILPIPYKNESIANELLTMDMPFRMKNIVERKTKIEIKNNDMLIYYDNARSGQLASFYRHQYADMGPEDRLKEFHNMYSMDRNTPVKVSDLNFTNLENLSDSVMNSLNVEIKSAVQDVADMKIFKLPWADAINSLYGLNLEERKYPFEFWSYLYNDGEIEQIEFIIPKGRKLLEVPQNVMLDSKIASYELRFNLKNTGELIATRIFTKKKDVVSVEEYPAFREFISAVSEHDNKQYVIK